MFTPVIVFGKSEDEFCGGDSGALFVEVADDESEEVVEGVFGVGLSEASFPLVHGVIVEWVELIEYVVNLCVMGDLVWKLDEVSGDEGSFEVEGEPFQSRFF